MKAPKGICGKPQLRLAVCKGCRIGEVADLSGRGVSDQFSLDQFFSCIGNAKFTDCGSLRGWKIVFLEVLYMQFA